MAAEETVIDLMAALEASVKEAKAARLMRHASKDENAKREREES